MKATEPDKTKAAKSIKSSKVDKGIMPRSVHESRSLACVATALGPCTTAVVEPRDKEIILERLRKEIARKFCANLSLKKRFPFQRLKHRMVIGVNVCSRALEKGGKRGEVLIVARDVRPPTVMGHIPSLARRHSIPLLLLPGRSSVELAEIFGIRKLSVILFLRSDGDSPLSVGEDRAIDSFINFIKTKAPSDAK